jgi:hypothetical protein
VRRAVLISVAGLFVALSLLFIATRGREPVTFRVELGTERVFMADDLVPGDRFACGDGDVLPTQGRGFGADGSDGTFIGTDKQGNVTIQCPEQLGEI